MMHIMQTIRDCDSDPCCVCAAWPANPRRTEEEAREEHAKMEDWGDEKHGTNGHKSCT